MVKLDIKKAKRLTIWDGLSMLEELSSLKMPPQGVKPRRQVKWQRLDEGWIKVNTNAAFDSNTCTGRAGVVTPIRRGGLMMCRMP